jgi:hypothetical protein
MTPFSAAAAGHQHQDTGELSAASSRSLRRLQTMPTAGSKGLPQSASVLLTHASEMPGPSFPFPSAARPRRPAGLRGVLQSALRPLKQARARAEGFTFLDYLQLFLPCIKWLRSYRVREYLLVSERVLLCACSVLGATAVLC